MKKHNWIKRHEEYINDNLLNEQFDRQNKNEVWVTDTTEVVYGNEQVKEGARACSDGSIWSMF